MLQDSSAFLLWFRLSVVFNKELSVRQFPGWWQQNWESRKVAASNFHSVFLTLFENQRALCQKANDLFFFTIVRMEVNWKPNYFAAKQV